MNMMRWTRLILFAGMIIMFSAACSSFHKRTKRQVAKVACAVDLAEQLSLQCPLPFPSVPAEFKDALTLLETRKYEEALQAFDVFLRDQPTTPWTQAAIFNSARALEELERRTEAIERYRRVARATEDLPALQALALYRISFNAEALGDDQATVAALDDAMKRSAYLPKEVSTAELPARMAAAYARVGNFERAYQLYESAESGIIRLRQAQSTEKVPDWLPRTLFYMGNMSLSMVGWDDFEIALRPLAKSQTYLLQAAELNVEPWSKRASDELTKTYRQLWNVIETAPIPQTSDPLVDRRTIQERQWDLAALLLENLDGLKARFLPSARLDVGAAKSDLSPEQAIVEAAESLRKNISDLFAQRPAGEGLTPESLRRMRSVRGRVISPDDSLERLYIKKRRGSAVVLPGTQALPDKTVVTPQAEDPNL